MLDLTPRELGEVRALREELPEQAIRVLVGAALPGTLRMREVDLDAGRLSEEPVLGHLLAPVVGQRAAHLLRQRTHLAGEGPAHAGRILRLQGHQERGARRALNQGAQGRGRPPAHQQVAFPVPWDRPVGYLRGPLLDADHVRQLPPAVVRQPTMACPSALVPVAQVGQQLPPQLAAGQHVQVRVDRLVRDPHGRIVRILRFQPGGNLLGRPALGQPSDHVGPQPPVQDQRPRASPSTPDAHRQPLCGQRPILVSPIAQPPPARPAQLARDRAGMPPELSGHGASACACSQLPADLLALGTAQSRVTWHRAQLLSPGWSQDTGVALAT